MAAIFAFERVLYLLAYFLVLSLIGREDVPEAEAWPAWIALNFPIVIGVLGVCVVLRRRNRDLRRVQSAVEAAEAARLQCIMRSDVDVD
jgi:hypothetical protein